MNAKTIYIFLFIFASTITNSFAEYEIKGSINLSSEWQPQIFLSTINKLDDYYNIDPEFIIQVGKIEQDGSFILRGDNLPSESRFYRLHLIKEEDTEFDACRYVGEDDHNFLHLILDNNTVVEIIPDDNHSSPFGKYTIKGDQANLHLRNLSLLIHPSFYFYQIKFHSELQFSQQKLNRDLFDFADSCDHILVSLAAMINTDMDKYYYLEPSIYEAFSARLNENLTNHSYSEDYFRKINYYNGDFSNTFLPTWALLLITILGIALLSSILKIVQLRRQLNQQLDTLDSTPLSIPNTITKQEQKILHLILEEKSNKEIAADLFIELSTVKTHINKLYSKLGVKNRSEAKTLAKSVLKVGV